MKVVEFLSFDDNHQSWCGSIDWGLIGGWWLGNVKCNGEVAST